VILLTHKRDKEVNLLAVLYTAREIQDALKTLRIKPIDGKVTTQEAARILSWRAKAEFGIDHQYHTSSVRRHIQMGNLKAEQVSTRFNRYKVEDIFDLPLSPNRGARQAGSTKEEAA
jgi:hypothetical protein